MVFWISGYEREIRFYHWRQTAMPKSIRIWSVVIGGVDADFSLPMASPCRVDTHSCFRMHVFFQFGWLDCKNWSYERCPARTADVEARLEHTMNKNPQLATRNVLRMTWISAFMNQHQLDAINIIDTANNNTSYSNRLHSHWYKTPFADS